MRHYNILPTPVIQASSLSKDGLRRLLWMDWYLTHGKNAELTCRHFGIAKSLFYRWKNRFNPHNLQSLEFDTKTRRPHNVREMTAPQSAQRLIYAIRKEDPEKSKYEIQAELKDEGILVGQSAIQHVINRYPELSNAQHLKHIRRHRVLKIARVKAAIELREKDLGSLVQIDTKYLSILGDKYYIFSAIDCKSRFGYIYAYSTISSKSAQEFVRRVREYFPFPIQAVNTDNGSEYLLNFHKEVEEWGIPHFFTNPRCPKQNGRVERFHQTVEYEYLNYQNLYPGLELLREQCLLFNEKYNYKRYHRSLGYKKPGEYVNMLLQQQKGEQPSPI
jgi:transposase InsO family protein